MGLGGAVGPFLPGLTAWGGSDGAWGGSGSRLLGKKGATPNVLRTGARSCERTALRSSEAASDRTGPVRTPSAEEVTTQRG